MAKRWHYMGDINLEHGGSFFDLSEMRHGYATVVEVTDLDSATGFTGAMMVEERTVITDQRGWWAGALSVIDASLLPNGDIDDGKPLAKNSLAWRMCLVYALSTYGAYDSERTEILQLDRSEPTKHEGWDAQRLRRDGLRGYVRREFLGLAR